jgi:hypothetical protein
MHGEATRVATGPGIALTQTERRQRLGTRSANTVRSAVLRIA